ncbi:MAG: hypothetical protein WBF73_01350 [Bradyrhizobium sp.]|jgi:hypothetical protein
MPWNDGDSMPGWMAKAENRPLDVVFQEAVHSVLTVKAEVAKHQRFSEIMLKQKDRAG